MSELRIRLDIWLWRARFAKTRAVAARLIAEGGVRLVRGDTSKAADKPAQAIGVGDVLLIRQGATLREIRVAAFGVRRGPPTEARALYELLPGSLEEASLDAPQGGVHVSAVSKAPEAKESGNRERE